TDNATSTSSTLLDGIQVFVSSQWPVWLTTQYLVMCLVLLSAFCSCVYGLLPEDVGAGTVLSRLRSRGTALTTNRRSRRSSRDSRARRSSRASDEDDETFLL
ncbi:unnamed protein product, partial [Ixodes hexagonus]